ncbi:fructokinase ScrK [Enterococcus faecalis]|uniref:fructokinase ScrK n=1 Tax=Enterococcus faecalis TaxID=1351 RepID=UPI00155E6848|nr:fructokinase ScrK [Enterococcus faecalis]NRC86464.1 ROK family protein [Enterococcus faecalis]
MTEKLLGSIEAGGTKFVCGVGTDDLTIVERVSFPTTTPEETMKKVIEFFQQYPLKAIGIGSFGPIDIHVDSPTYGYITSTPKLAWRNFDLLGTMKQHFDVPMAWTTDVNAAAYGEYVAGNGQHTSSCVYYTIGTGVGAGAIQNGEFIEGFSHPEMGHALVRRHSEDTYAGNCPYHGDCLEGIAAGPAVEGRSGKKGHLLEEDHKTWELEAYYLAQAAYNTTLLLAPEVIILGGGVMKQRHLMPKVREKFAELVNGYVETPPLDKYLVTPLLEDNPGTIGCFALAKKALMAQK